jgi:protein-tyrosine phosphatase
VAEDCLHFCDGALQPEQTKAASPHPRLLIHCSAGQSRSAALLLHYLMTRHGLRYAAAYALLRRQRPVVDIHTDHLAPLRALDVSLQQKKV